MFSDMLKAILRKCSQGGSTTKTSHNPIKIRFPLPQNSWNWGLPKKKNNNNNNNNNWN